MSSKITICDLYDYKRNNRKISAVSCYDYTTARLVDRAGVDMILVGDSAAQIMLGYDSTLPVTMDFMVTITKAVRKAAPNICLVADMPFLSYQTSISEAVKNAGRFVVESGAQIVKIEASSAQLDVIKAVSDAGMSVMAHIGLRPQSITKLGKLKAEGTTADMAYELILLADRMLQAGANFLLIEASASEAARIITERADAPVISCGSGPHCDGQILVIADILGITEGPVPKFAHAFANLADDVKNAVADYSRQVKRGLFPNDAQCYHIKDAQVEKLKKMLKKSQ